MRCFVYCRVSTEEQSGENHHSLQYQEEKARTRIKDEGWRLYKMRKDVGSGKGTEHREGYLELLEAIRDKKVDAVIVHSLDRLSRNLRDIFNFVELTEEHGVEFVSLTEVFDTTSPMGKVMLAVTAVFAQFTRETIAENVRYGLEQRAKLGKWTGAPMPPYGYDYTPADGLTPHPDEAEVVRRIFHLYTEKKLNHGKIAKLLNTEGTPSKTGKQWSSVVIGRLLKNPVYVGKIKYNSLVAEGLHEALVTDEQFQAAQDLVNSRRRTSLHPRTRTANLLLLGIATCGYCGRNLGSHPRNRSGARYRCHGNQKVGDDACDGFFKVAHRVDDAVVGRIREVTENGALQQLAAEEVHRMVETTVEPAREERDHILEELGRISEDFTRWANRLDKGIVDEEQFEQHNRTLLNRKEKLQGRLEEIQEGLGQYDRVEVNLQEVQSVLSGFDELWGEGTLEERKALMAELVEDLRVTKDKVTLKLRFLEETEIPIKLGR